MYIKSLKITNFKTLKDFSIQFNKGFNLIIGKNNTGKSNILEALDKIISDRCSFSYNDLSKIDNASQQSPEFDLEVSDKVFKKKNNIWKINGHDKNVEQFKKVLSNIKMIYIDIQKEYSNLIQTVIEDYKGLSDVEKQIFDTQVNIDFNEVMGQGNNVYVKDDSIYVIDEYADVSTIENKSSGVQRVALILFIITLFKVKKKSDKYILLIDEPEGNLHVRSQRKMHKLLLDFSKNHQVIISSHSTIFMQDIDNNSINYIDRDKRRGSFTDNNNLGGDNFRKIRDTLGLQISDTLFLNRNIVAVEGEIDVIIHKYIYNRLNPYNEKYTFFTIEGADRAIQNIITLKQVLNREIIIILDNDAKGEKIKKQIENQDFVKGSRVLFQPIEGEGELEDLFPKEFMIKTIKEYVEKHEHIINKTLGDKATIAVDEYKERLENYNSFSEIENIIDDKKSFQIKSKIFANYIIRKLGKLPDDEFESVAKSFGNLYRGF